MNKKLILTSLVAMSIALPAIAEPEAMSYPDPDASDPATMWYNRTYTGAATEDNMDGVYEENDSVYAVAEYGNTTFNISAGKYLPANSETGALCPNGYYCPGGQLEYSENESSGLTQCPEGFSSDSGAASDTQCYRTCNSVNMGTGQGYTIAPIAHADAITGRDYYGSGTDTCAPSTCVHGWHIKNMNPGKAGSSLGVSYENSAGVTSAYVDSNGGFHGYDLSGDGGNSTNETSGMSYFGLDSHAVKPGDWLVEYSGAWKEVSNNVWASDYSGSEIFVFGEARRSSVQGNNNSNTWSNPAKLTTEQMGAAEDGQYCYCRLTKYKEDSGGAWYDLDSPWVYAATANSLNDCASECTNYMRRKHGDGGYYQFRGALFSSATPGLSYCEANTIKVKWYGTTSAAVSANNAGTVTYGGDIVTPTSYTPITGKRFKGWRFSSEPPAEGTPANPD